MRFCLIKIFFVFSFLCLCNVNASGYKLIDLGILDYNSEIYSINDHGQIVGNLTKDEKDYLFFWDPNIGVKLIETKNCYYAKINNASTIVFSEGCYDEDYNVVKLFKWDNPSCNTQCQELNFQPKNSQKYHLEQFYFNDIGQILLVYESDFLDELTNLESAYKNYIYENGNLNLIKSSKLTMGMTINNNSQIFGCNIDISGRNIIVKPIVYDYKNKKTHTWDNLDNAIPCYINDQGQILAVFVDIFAQTVKGTFFGSLQKDDFIILSNIVGSKMNNHGQIIGELAPNGVLHTQDTVYVIWDNGNETKLSDISLVDDKGHTWDSLDELCDINDQGQIVGSGTYHGEQHGFLLVPVN